MVEKKYVLDIILRKVVRGQISNGEWFLGREFRLLLSMNIRA